MTRVHWDGTGEKRYETGTDRGMLYRRDVDGDYTIGVPWNGLTGVTDTPSGAEASAQYADNQKYINLVSQEEAGGTIKAFTYPEEFDECNGAYNPVPGVTVGQQGRKSFGFSYRTLVGNDVENLDFGYKIHMVWGATASPSEKDYATTNDSPEAMEMSWEYSTSPVTVGTVGGHEYKPVSTIVIDSTRVSEEDMTALEDILYGDAAADPELPDPSVIIAMFDLTEATATAPTFDSGTNTITIPVVTGVTYRVNGSPVSGSVVIEEDTTVVATANPGYILAAGTHSWTFVYEA